MSTPPLVSIGLPVRNGAAGITTALESLTAQTWPNLEIVVSDNASTDDTVALVEQVAARDPRVRLIRQQRDIGMMANFHEVAAQSRGEFFLWAAHDDTRDANFVAVLMQAMATQPAGVVLVHGDTDEVFEGFVRRHAPDFVTRGMAPAARLRRIARGQSFFLYGLWRRDAAARLPMRELYWWPDMPPMLAAAALGEFAHAPGATFRYTHHPRPFFRGRAGALTALPLLVMQCARAVSHVAGLWLGLLAGVVATQRVLDQIADFALVRLGVKRRYIEQSRAA
jgi:glycosyltransferase involved in cell wall biosynthesis